MARVREIIRADRRLTIREVAEEVNIAFGTCQKILTEDMRMRRVTAKFVPPSPNGGTEGRSRGNLH